MNTNSLQALGDQFEISNSFKSINISKMRKPNYGLAQTFKLTALMMLLAVTSFNQVSAEATDIFEHVIYEDLSQEARTYAYYTLTIGERYYETEEEHITVKVIAENFDSDPDVFISKTNPEPTSSLDSDFYCEREGSETCIIHNGEFEVGDTLYIGVKCDRECQYKLRVWFTSEIDLVETSRAQKRFDAYSTQILKYYIESETEDGATTNHIEIIISPENDYVHIDAYISLDDSFYLIEEKPASHVVDNGIAFKFGSNDYEWCVKCYVYVILNVVEESRYYITSQGRHENDDLSEYIPTEIMVNPFTQECYGYFILRTREDVRFTIEGYTGHADVYISPRDKPDNALEYSQIMMRGGHGTQRAIVIKSDERENFGGYSTGTYYLCFYAYTPFSAKVTTLERDFESIYDYNDGEVLTQTIYASTTAYGRYTNTQLNSKLGSIKVHLDVQSEEDASSIKIWYKTCESSTVRDCVLTEEELLGASDTMQGITSINDNNQVSGQILHYPYDCTNSNGDIIDCVYLIAIENVNSEDDLTIQMSIEGEFYNPGDVLLEQEYKDTINHGESIRYELNNIANPDMAYLHSLKIKLNSIMGDADLFVSFSNPNPNAEDHDYASRRTNAIDEVYIEEEGGLGINSLNRTIFFNVVGFTRAQYKISFEYEFMTSFDENLGVAKQIGDGQYIEEYLASEYDEGFYRFRPWWSENENRTMVFLADVIYNKVFFYAQWNAYPKHFLTTKHDVNDTIVVYGSDEDYHHTGDWYVRLRPDFAMYDLLSEREYIYQMYLFSQPQANGGETGHFQLLELGVDQIGFSNRTDYQDYRFLIVDMTAEFDIRLTRIPGQGKPVFFIKMMNSQDGNFQYSQLPRSDGYHYKSSENEEKPVSVQNLTLTEDMRATRTGCVGVKSSLQENGDLTCFLAISVMCEDEKDCAYNLRIDQKGFNYTEQSSKAVENFTASPPQPILENEYINGNISYDKIRYYYLPVAREDYGNSLILLNKTQIFSSGENGDSRMLINLQNNTSDDEGTGFNYTQWIYPNDNRAGAITATGNNSWPEIIEPCEEIMIDFCDNADGCTFVVGVAGSTNLTQSSYRIKGFRGHNKIHMNTPIVKEVPVDSEGMDAFDFYWFVINDTVVDPSIYFNYQISVASSTGNDPDLFVSVMDGRWPSETDYDFKSTLQGADSVKIESNDTFWANNGWNTSAGVTVVIGVKQELKGEYTLMLTSPQQSVYEYGVQRIRVGESIQITLPELEDLESKRGYETLFQLYNWGHENIEFQLEAIKGNATLMYQKIGQDIIDQNIYTGIPMNKNNSYEIVHADADNSTIGDINSAEIEGEECFNCWYFIRIQSDSPGETEFSFTVPLRSDSGGPAQIEIGNFGQIYILATTSTKRKFIVDSKDNLQIEATIASGEVNMYVGLDPDTVGPDDYLWSATTEGSLATLQIKTTDKNFHSGTYYYIYLAASEENDSLLNLHLTQQRSVDFIPNNHDSTYTLDHGSFNDDLMFVKFQYQSVGEEIKFHVMQTPGAIEETEEDAYPWIPQYFRATIVIESLTPHFYPQVYLNKIELDEEPSELSTLTFPTIDTHDIAFGEDPISQLHSNRFEYTWYNVSTEPYNYYTMAIYQNNWQLTDYKKSEYQIKVDVDIVDECEVIECATEEASEEDAEESSEEVSGGAVRMEDGSVWKWLESSSQAQAERDARMVESQNLREQANADKNAALENIQ